MMVEEAAETCRLLIMYVKEHFTNVHLLVHYKRLKMYIYIYIYTHTHTPTHTQRVPKKRIHILNDNRASASFFDCPACRMVTLAFI